MYAAVLFSWMVPKNNARSIYIYHVNTYFCYDFSMLFAVYLWPSQNGKVYDRYVLNRGSTFSGEQTTTTGRTHTHAQITPYTNSQNNQSMRTNFKPTCNNQIEPLLEPHSPSLTNINYYIYHYQPSLTIMNLVAYRSLAKTRNFNGYMVKPSPKTKAKPKNSWV